MTTQRDLLISQPTSDRVVARERTGISLGSALRYVTVAATIVALVVVWQLITEIFSISEVLLPAPTKVIAEIPDSWNLLLDQSIPTLEEALIGFGLGILLGVPLGALLARPTKVNGVLYPLVLGAQIFPKVAVAPLFIVWFGFGMLPKVLFVILLTFFPITLNTIEGFRNTPTEVRDLGRVLRMGTLRRICQMEFPSALPQILTGITISASFAIIAAIVFEFVGSNKGLGYLINATQSNLNTTLMFAALICVTFIGFIFYGAARLMSRLLIPWHVSNRSKL